MKNKKLGDFNNISISAPASQQQLDNAVEKHKFYILQFLEAQLESKIDNIASYLRKFNLNKVVVGVSGGIDSALVIALLVEVKKRHIPDLKIYGYTIHFSIYDGIFDPTYIKLMEDRFGSDVIFKTVDGSNTMDQLMIDLGVSDNDPQLVAQSSYALRYQMFFTYAQLHGAITIGTTNYSEYVTGWFGKNSDMVVDLQVIADWHKCEVVKAAEILNVPFEIINRKPAGDLLDNSSDEDNFGCSYDELAFYFSFRDLMKDSQFRTEKFAKLEALRMKNEHKFQGQGFNPVFISS